MTGCHTRNDSKIAAGTSPKNSCSACLRPAGISHMSRNSATLVTMSALIAGESGPGPNEKDECEGPRDG